MTKQLLPILLAFISGCATSSRSVYEPLSEGARNPLEAQRLTLKAADLMLTDPQRAERYLRSALSSDLYHGPAHNNLGVLFLNEGKLYEAANEFEWARKLMPGHPDPRLNLALTALEVFPGHIPTMQAIARLQVRFDRTDDRIDSFLREIALRGETPHWRQWAQGTMVRFGVP
jgi:tetratricopeptide (TPR) repeat protein